MLSPAVTSPLVPSSKNAALGAPPMVVRSPVTASPVLGGSEPGVTLTVSSVSPAATLDGFALPTAVGPVETTEPCGVSEKSSMARPSSAPLASKSIQRIQNVAPGGMLSPVIVALKTVRFAAALPSFAPICTGCCGSDEVERGNTRVHAGVDGCRRRAVLEIEFVGPAGCAEPPFLTRVGDVQARDGRAGVVGERGADDGRQRAASQCPERPVGAAGRAEGVDVARIVDPTPAV